ncbi:acylphosphatase [Tessaracoccus sp. OS52]|uniref:acylphosphatase n=1 Tax=Tessaracoccus sp. OS52 TaxID=2886691 RepID=UPI001D0FB8F9|nr:acylphosphatase [Tessaracoccus sp. OS52]MCC2593403.1 acylphosphatase [Tessaracoccus sp. OS52]
MRRVHVVVSGMVQGVGFRYHALRHAEHLGLGGWIRNRADGTVEAEVEGAPEAVDGLLGWLADGPPGARVRNVRVSDVAPTGETSFDIRH